MNYWLVKSEPEEYSWGQFTKDKKADWTGVRNFKAMSNLRSMKKGDLVLFYHTGDEKQIVGLATVSKEHFKDSTATEGPWVAVELKPQTALTTPVTLAQVKAEKALKATPLAKEPRLSVQSLNKPEFDTILAMAQTKI